MAAGQIIGAVAGATGAVAGAIDTKQKQRLADKTGFQTTTEQLLTLKRERENRGTQTKEIVAKSNKTLVIVGGVVLCVFILGLFIFLVKKSKQ